MSKAVLTLLIFIGVPLPLQAQASAPYAGQQMRQLKALSPEDIRAYREGQGMGLAKAGELNHYPGPKHVLELAAKLNLSQQQIAHAQRTYDKMHVDAVRLGALIIRREGRLDTLFASGRVNVDQMELEIREIARLQGELRAVHLRAHLEMKRELSKDQIARYDQLRGYQSGSSHQHHEHGE
ncbi:MAG TPA: hypothetical protein VGL91_11810 [Acidobacteriota bacterium]